MSTCRSCGHPVIWTATPAGHRMPIDAAPVDDGNLHLDQTTNPPTVTVVNTLQHDPGCGRRHYTSHFATCLDANEWRKR